MRNEDWFKMMEGKSLDALLIWLINSYDSYMRENHDKWNTLRHASILTENFKEAVDYNNREADAQKERYEWLLNYISTHFEKKAWSIKEDKTDICGRCAYFECYGDSKDCDGKLGVCNYYESCESKHHPKAKACDKFVRRAFDED